MRKNRGLQRVAAYLAVLLAAKSFALSRLLPFRVRKPSQAGIIIPKMLVESAAPYVGAMGVAGGVLGLFSRSRVAAGVSMVLGTVAAATCASYTRQILALRGDFEGAFGRGWEAQLPEAMKSRMLKQQWRWRLSTGLHPRWQRNVPFWSLPGRDKSLLCDIWQPPVEIQPSGLAFIYLHGSAWHYLDKDFGTRPMFRHLASQGHVVMDVAYRLAPETDISGMIGDAKRAIAWMKRNADRYGVDPRKIVIAGGSAGGHLALMAAYTADLPDFVPDDVGDADTSVRGVVAWYGPVDLAAIYEYGLHMSGTADAEPTRTQNPIAQWIARLLQNSVLGPNIQPYSLEQMYTNLIGAIPPQNPDAARKASPLTHVRAGCPPTLLFQGDSDSLVPVEATRTLYASLKKAGVPAMYLEFPQTEHAFDLILAGISLPGQVALYTTDRFLALLAAPQTDKSPSAPVAETTRVYDGVTAV